MKKFILVVAAAMAALPSSAFAQVSSGNTEVTTIETPEHAKAREGEIKDVTELAIQGGSLVAGGNSRTTAATAGSRFLIRRNVHEGSSELAWNYARSGTEDGGMDTTVENYQGRVRYDYFFNKRMSLFLAVQTRRDRFQGLNLRLGVDPGVSYYFARNASTRFWLEAGYDFQYEVRTDETLELAEEAGTPIDKTEPDHNTRLFVGFDQKLDDRLQLVAGLEYFKSFVTAENWRLNWTSALNIKLFDSFSLAIGSTALYNNAPLPEIKKLDVSTSLSFVYTLL